VTADQQQGVDNPYRPPDDLNPTSASKPDLAYWVYGYVALRVFGALLVAVLFWLAKTNMPEVVHAEWSMWAMLTWILLGTLAAVAVAFRIRWAKHLLVGHLVCTAVVELYAFNAMMGLEFGPGTEAALGFGWAYFGMAVWDLAWAALFQFSRGLRAALDRSREA
jgi:hypothetical protein